MIYKGPENQESDPPTYDSLVGASSSGSGSGSGPRSRSQPTTPSASSSSFHLPPISKPPVSASAISKSWIPWTAAQRTSNEVQANIRNLVRELVVGMDSSPGSSESLAEAAAGILYSCADACAKHGVSFATILQDKYVEEHSPLYWAIVKQSPIRPGLATAPAARQSRPAPSEKHGLEADLLEAEGGAGAGTGTPDILGLLVSYSMPMKSSTISELRLACVSVSDQTAFQRLRILVPKFSFLSGTDRVLLGSALSMDDVKVTIASSANNANDGAFAVDMQFAQFHKRLMVSREIGAEFVVRNRIWRFTLTYLDSDWYEGPKAGSWCAKLSLQDESPPTWFDGRLILVEPHTAEDRTAAAGEPAKPKSLDPPPPPPPQTPVHCVRMRSFRSYRLEPTWSRDKNIAVSLEDEPAFAGLQYTESSFISADEKLTLRLEALLTKPSSGKNDDD